MQKQACLPFRLTERSNSRITARKANPHFAIHVHRSAIEAAKMMTMVAHANMLATGRFVLFPMMRRPRLGVRTHGGTIVVRSPGDDVEAEGTKQGSPRAPLRRRFLY